MIIGLVTVLVLTIGSVVTGEEFKVDGYTTLLCHFNGNLKNEAGGVEVNLVVSIEDGGSHFVPGKFAQGVFLGKRYLSLKLWEVFNQAEGTIEMWLKPHWDVDEPDKYNNNMGFFTSGLFSLDCIGGPPLTVRWFSDGGVSIPPGSYLVAEDIKWHSDEWRYIAATWQDKGEKQSILELYINGELMLKSDNATIPKPSQDWMIQIGRILRHPESKSQDSKLEVVFDEIRISSIRRTPDEMKASYKIGKGE